MSGPEGKIEDYLVSELKRYGFRCDKGKVPGKSGFPDRWIFRPKWSPGAPMLLELKDEGKEPRKLQVKQMDDLKARGVVVLGYIDSKSGVDELVTQLVGNAVWHLSPFYRNGLPKHILSRWRDYNGNGTITM